MTQVDEGVGQDDAESAGVGRRRFLRRGAITAAVAAAGAAAIASPAGAADNDTIKIGSANDANNTGTTTTKLTGSQFQALNGNGNLSLVGQHDTNNAVGIEGRANVGAQVRLLPNALNLLDTNDSHVFQGGSLIADTNKILWYALEDGAGADTGLHPISLTAAFLPVSPPIRAYDSRFGAPPSTGIKGSINGNIGQERDIHIIVPGSNVLAIFVNLTVVGTTGAGFLAMFAADEVWDPSFPFSSINWFTNGQITANGVASAIDNTTGNVRIHAGGQGTTDFLIDVTGLWVI
jgi:hypothetical protein